jgi:hypothetical protein
MNTVHLRKVQHTMKRMDVMPEVAPSITEDSLLVADGETVGFFLLRVPEEVRALVRLADIELRSARVPKTMMERKAPAGKRPDGKYKYYKVQQYSCILGTCPAKPHMRRPYTTRSSVHGVASARPFVKAMLLIGRACLGLIRDLTPTIYETHVAAVSSRVPPQWRFADYFTSSISNCNKSAPLHRDNMNVRGAVNAIICTRHHATGGNLHVPDYNATFDQPNHSLLVYPAWRNAHAVTPIVATRPGGYRNSLIWYAIDMARVSGNNPGS